MSSLPRPPLVVGVGTDERADDGVGLDVARALAREGADGAEVIAWPGELTGLLDLFAGRPLVVVVDAVRSGAAGGTVHRWEVARGGLFPPSAAVSTHGLSLASVLELGRALDRLPERLVVYGVEAETVAAGTDRSEAVRRAVDLVRGQIVRELLSRSPFRAATGSDLPEGAAHA